MLFVILATVGLVNEEMMNLFDTTGTNWWKIALVSVDILLVITLYVLGKQTVSKSIDRENQFRNLVELSPEPVLIHRGGKFIYVNQAGAKIVGLKHPHELINRYAKDFVDTESFEMMQAAEANQELSKRNVKVTRTDGTVIILEMTATTIMFDGAPARNVNIRDITCQVKETESLQEIAYQDDLTGLLNRRGLVDKINQDILDAKRENNRFGVMFIDLDGFKLVNDKFGHETGDLVLKNVGKYLKTCIGKQDIVARLGGDEFVILLRDTNEEKCIQLAQKIIEPQDANSDAFGNTLVTPSIGIALSPENGEDVETLIKQADLAMYEAKHNGKNNYHFAEGIQPELKKEA